MDCATKKLKKLLLLCPLPAPMPAAADGMLVFMTPYTVGSTAEAQLNVVPPNHFDSPWAMMFLPDQSLLVTLKRGALWLLGQAGQSPGEGDAAAETVPSVVHRAPVAGLPDIRAVGQGQYGHRLALLLEGMAAEVWTLGHRNPLNVEKRVSQTVN